MRSEPPDPAPPPAEPAITINGVTLTSGEAMTVRVAVNNFLIDLQHHSLCDDEHGQKMDAFYLATLREILSLMEDADA